MKHRLIFILALTAPVAFCAAPDSLAGRVFHESSVSNVSVRSGLAFALFLNADGTYQSIYYSTTYRSSFQDPPPDGRWSYRKTGENTAELVLNFESERRQLNFLSSDKGRISGPLRFGSFWLVNPADQSTRAPLVNCSNRSLVTAEGTATAGFVVSESPTTILIRAAGPSLAQFGVEFPLAAPVLEVFSREIRIASNTRWATSGIPETIRRSANYVGAFPFPQDSPDSAVILVLQSGAYTAQVTSGDGRSGEVLVEVYLLR